jgi:hypothetical protein
MSRNQLIIKDRENVTFRIFAFGSIFLSTFVYTVNNALKWHIIFIFIYFGFYTSPYSKKTI